MRKELFQDHECGGRVTWEHPFLFRNKELQEPWAVVPICEKAHSVGAWQTRGGIMNKEMNRAIALSRATDADLRKYPTAYQAWAQMKRYLMVKYAQFLTPVA